MISDFHFVANKKFWSQTVTPFQPYTCAIWINVSINWCHILLPLGRNNFNFYSSFFCLGLFYFVHLKHFSKYLIIVSSKTQVMLSVLGMPKSIICETWYSVKSMNQFSEWTNSFRILEDKIKPWINNLKIFQVNYFIILQVVVVFSHCLFSKRNLLNPYLFSDFISQWKNETLNVSLSVFSKPCLPVFTPLSILKLPLYQYSILFDFKHYNSLFPWKKKKMKCLTSTSVPFYVLLFLLCLKLPFPTLHTPLVLYNLSSAKLLFLQQIVIGHPLLVTDLDTVVILAYQIQSRPSWSLHSSSLQGLLWFHSDNDLIFLVIRLTLLISPHLLEVFICIFTVMYFP